MERVWDPISILNRFWGDFEANLVDFGKILNGFWKDFGRILGRFLERFDFTIFSKFLGNISC